MNHAMQAATTIGHQAAQGLSFKHNLKARKPRLLLLITDDWYFRSHRLDLAKEARDAGMEVFVTTFADDGGKWITREGFTYLPIPFVKGTRQPLQELTAVLKLANLYRRVRPDIVHHVALKPILYGSWAARLVGIPAVLNAFGGLGFVFSADGWQSRLLRIAVRAALCSALSLPNCRVLFQNREDCDQMLRQRIVQSSQTVIIPGVGVDTATFTPHPEMSGLPVIVLACRMLWDKGVGEFVHAARLLKQQNVGARFVLVGRTDFGNPTHIPESQLRAWQNEDVVEWWGHRDDMPGVLAGAHVVVLPSYYEGFPKILLEACSCAKPVIATAIPGCVQIVRDGENGFLIPPKDPETLAKVIRVLLENPLLRTRLGTRGREIVEREFTARRMAKRTLAVYHELLANCDPLVGTLGIDSFDG